MRDMNPHVATFNILIFQMTDFANSETGRVHEGNHGFLLQVRNGGDEGFYFLLGRYVRQVIIKFTKRKLCRIPRFVKYVNGKET